MTHPRDTTLTSAPQRRESRLILRSEWRYDGGADGEESNPLAS